MMQQYGRRPNHAPTRRGGAGAPSQVFCAAKSWRRGNSLAPGMFDPLGVERPQGAEPKNKTICLWQMVLFLVRAWGLEPQRRKAREPKGDVTLVKYFFSALLFFTLFHLLLKCLFQHFPPRLLGQGILIQLAHFYRLANLNIGFAKGERDHTRCTGRDSSANY